MPPSVLESTVRQSLYAARRTLLSHDRGVLLGILLSLVPIPPLPVFGLIINLANWTFLRSGRLPQSERGAVRLGLLLAIVNSVIVTVLVTILVRWAGSVQWTNVLASLPHALTSLLPWANSSMPSSGATSL